MPCRAFGYRPERRWSRCEKRTEADAGGSDPSLASRSSRISSTWSQEYERARASAGPSSRPSACSGGRGNDSGEESCTKGAPVSRLVPTVNPPPLSTADEGNASDIRATSSIPRRGGMPRSDRRRTHAWCGSPRRHRLDGARRASTGVRDRSRGLRYVVLGDGYAGEEGVSIASAGATRREDSAERPRNRDRRRHRHAALPAGIPRRSADRLSSHGALDAPPAHAITDSRLEGLARRQDAVVSPAPVLRCAEVLTWQSARRSDQPLAASGSSWAVGSSQCSTAPSLDGEAGTAAKRPSGR